MFTYLRIMAAARKARMDERGASAVEYGLLVAGIAAIIVAIVFLLGGQITDAFQDTCDELNARERATANNCGNPNPPPAGN